MPETKKFSKGLNNRIVRNGIFKQAPEAESSLVINKNKITTSLNPCLFALPGEEAHLFNKLAICHAVGKFTYVGIFLPTHIESRLMTYKKLTQPLQTLTSARL